MIWFFSIIYIFEPFGGGTLAYMLTTTGAWIAYILSSLISKGVKVKKKQPSQWIGLCKSKMVLSNYMHSLAWTRYLRKIGCKPITISCRFHRLGLKGMLILHALCTNSVGVLATRTQNSVMLTKSFFERHPVVKINNNKMDFQINLENIGVFDKFSVKESNNFLST